MRTIYLTSVTVHVLAAVFWLGGMFFLALVGAPVLRRVEPPHLRAELFARLGASFRGAGWAAIGVLILTGVVNLHLVGVLRGGRWADPGFWETPYGSTLAWKLTFVAAMVTLSAIHDFSLGPRAGRAAPGTLDSIRLRRRASWLARLSAVFGVLLVIAAVRLARGG
jgi:copper resistance protein D